MMENMLLDDIMYVLKKFDVEKLRRVLWYIHKIM